jgi:desulfoferrodoxin (superoxide reductase-like protein)
VAGGLLRERADERLRDLLESGALLHTPEEEHHYSWVEGYVEWLEGKDAREQYYALLTEEFSHLER